MIFQNIKLYVKGKVGVKTGHYIRFFKKANSAIFIQDTVDKNMEIRKRIKNVYQGNTN